LQSTVGIICPSQTQTVSNISLSGVSVGRRVEDLSENVFTTSKSKSKDFVFYSTAMGESADTAQLSIFVPEVDKSFILWRNWLL
jgi:hypothetical protein